MAGKERKQTVKVLVQFYLRSVRRANGSEGERAVSMCKMSIRKHDEKRSG
jgi:hypothetical protein